jgi:ribosomal protein S18 acetylase RimI-like enzyme
VGPATGQPEVTIRPARGEDAQHVAALLYESSAGKYDEFAGDATAANRLLVRAFARPGNSASREVVSVAEVGGVVAGALAAFPVAEGDRRARRFLATALLGLGPWAWPRALRVYRLGTEMTPPPPAAALYVDALATSSAFRRRGVARALLRDAERRATETRLTAVALDTGIANDGARALYARAGYLAGERREPGDGVPGVVAYVKRVSA